jgi:hypothetical protein
LTSTLEPKRLGLLHELVPQATTIAVLLNPNFQAGASAFFILSQSGERPER